MYTCLRDVFEVLVTGDRKNILPPLTNFLKQKVKCSDELYKWKATGDPYILIGLDFYCKWPVVGIYDTKSNFISLTAQ